MIAGAALVAVLTPTIAYAVHDFTDVPNAAFYHNDVHAVKLAGITAGCGATTYCPNDPVTRGSMATFLNRGLSRIAMDSGTSFADIGGDFAFDVMENEIILVPGTGATAVQYVKAEGWFVLNSVATGCPCEIGVQLTDGTTTSPEQVYQVEAGALGDMDQTIHASFVFPEPAGESVLIEMEARLFSTTGSAATSYNVDDATVILTTFPTAADGSIGTLAPASGPRPRETAPAS